MNRLCGNLLIVLAFTISAPPTHGDWLNLTGAETAPNVAEIFVEKERVRVALEIDLADFSIFAEGEGETGATIVEPPPEPDAATLARFTGDALPVVTDGGSRLEAEVGLIEVRDRKERATARSAMLGAFASAAAGARSRSARVVYVELHYPSEAQPRTLTFTPPLDQAGRPLVTIGFIAYHAIVPITDYRYLSGPETLVLDWDDPWYTAFENPNLTRHHKSALMSFLYVEPREVRHEIIFRLRDLETWTDTGLGTAETLNSDLIERARRSAEAFFAERNPLVIDGVDTSPATVRTAFLDLGVAGLQVLDDPGEVDRSTAIMGVILSYPQPALAERVEMRWQLFNGDIEVIPVRVTDPAGGVPGQITADDPVVVWTNLLTSWEDPSPKPVAIDGGRGIGIPVLSAILLIVGGVAVAPAFRPAASGRKLRIAAALGAGVAALLLVRVAVVEVPVPFAGSPDVQAATQAVEGFVRNAGHAMIEPEPDGFRAALETFVAADRIEPVGAEIQRGLLVTLPTGGRARTDTIDAISVEDITTLDGAPGIGVLASWTARVSGGHWGHAHRREVRYRALMEAVEIDGFWKLRGLTVLSARTPA